MDQRVPGLHHNRPDIVRRLHGEHKRSHTIQRLLDLRLSLGLRELFRQLCIRGGFSHGQLSSVLNLEFSLGNSLIRLRRGPISVPVSPGFYHPGNRPFPGRPCPTIALA
jgi:hypothetical protein